MSEQGEREYAGREEKELLRRLCEVLAGERLITQEEKARLCRLLLEDV